MTKKQKDILIKGFAIAAIAFLILSSAASAVLLFFSY